ncbi:Hypothetical predicted protein [Octopus vulgaris]|uniref:Uncharacterized protein n=1 Tax=Octopus vulgaris TaxID=6645 RepID=A0AA36F6I9_OCTVU|nr:Hypothetical predicted protein [Octopus vulgaris]
MHLQLLVLGSVARTEPPNGGEEEDQVRRVRAVRDTLEEGSEYTMARWMHCEIRESRRYWIGRRYRIHQSVYASAPVIMISHTFTDHKLGHGST